MLVDTATLANGITVSDSERAGTETQSRDREETGTEKRQGLRQRQGQRHRRDKDRDCLPAPLTKSFNELSVMYA